MVSKRIPALRASQFSSAPGKTCPGTGRRYQAQPYRKTIHQEYVGSVWIYLFFRSSQHTLGFVNFKALTKPPPKPVSVGNTPKKVLATHTEWRFLTPSVDAYIHQGKQKIYEFIQMLGNVDNIV